MGWREIESNPNHPRVRRYLSRELERRYSGRIAEPAEFLDAFVAGRSTLDVGAVQHSLDQIEQPHWKHGRIRQRAARVVGVDILAPEVEELRRRGYDVRCVDATSDTDLGERFDRVVMGDVIEHVDSPVGLLRFARRHLAPQGRALVMTPNPHFFGYVAGAFVPSGFLPNAEHVAWFSPSMALELGERAGLALTRYWHLGGDGRTLGRRVLSSALSALRLRDASLFSVALYFEYALPGAAPA